MMAPETKLPPKDSLGGVVARRGRPPMRLRRDLKHQPISVKQLALGLSKRAWRKIEWRAGSTEPLVSLRADPHSCRSSRRSARRSACWNGC
jgi:hypothetical protein